MITTNIGSKIYYVDTISWGANNSKIRIKPRFKLVPKTPSYLLNCLDKILKVSYDYEDFMKRNKCKVIILINR